MEQTYGLVDADDRRIYASPRLIKIVVNGFGEMYYQDLNKRLYLTLDWKYKKVTFPTIKELKELHSKILSENFKATRVELRAFEIKLEKAIQHFNWNKNSIYLSHKTPRGQKCMLICSFDS